MAAAPDIILWLSFRARTKKTGLLGVEHLQLTFEKPERPTDSEGHSSEEASPVPAHSAWSSFECNRICIKDRVTAGTQVHVVFHFYGKYPLVAAALCH